MAKRSIKPVDTPDADKVGWRQPRRLASPALAKDPNRERQSRYCQGFDPDWWMPALDAANWKTQRYPLARNQTSVMAWVDSIKILATEYCGPLDDLAGGQQLLLNLDNDIAIIRRVAPEIAINNRDALPKMPVAKDEVGKNGSSPPRKKKPLRSNVCNKVRALYEAVWKMKMQTKKCGPKKLQDHFRIDAVFKKNAQSAGVTLNFLFFRSAIEYGRRHWAENDA